MYTQMVDDGKQEYHCFNHPPLKPHQGQIEAGYSEMKSYDLKGLK
jgi:hypothetical protein